MPIYRHIDTTGLPDKFDVSDLIDQGLTDEELFAWCAERVRPGPPVLTKEEMKPVRKKQPVDIKAKKLPPKTSPKSQGNVVPITEPEPAAHPDYDFPTEFSEDQLADDFTKKYHKKLAYCASWKTWLHWQDNVWNRDDTFLAPDLARRICRDAANLAKDRLDLGAKSKTIANSISSRRCFSAVEGIARSDRRHVVRPSQFDADPWILNTPDGIIDLVSGEVRPAKRSDWCVKSTAVGLGGKCPVWLSFLQDCTQGDADLQAYLKRVAGYCLTGSIAEQKFFFIYGGGGNGKGTFLNMLMWLMASYGRQSNMDTFTEQRFSKHASEIAFFQGARLVVASETNVGQRWNEARIKGMTGGDPITANHMHSDPFTFNPTFKLLFNGNHKPHLKNVDPAIKRRLYLIPFEYEVPEDKIDGTLDVRLQAEAGGILAWALEGCLEWQKERLNPPTRVIATTAEYFEAEDRIATFLEECCTKLSGSSVMTTALYKRFCTWADTAGEYSGSRKGFLDMMGAKGYHSITKGGSQVIEGLVIPYTPAAGDGDIPF